MPLGHPGEPPLLGQKGKGALLGRGLPPSHSLLDPVPGALSMHSPQPQIAEKVGCPVDDTSKMAGCLKITDPRALTLAYKLPLGTTECE